MHGPWEIYGKIGKIVSCSKIIFYIPFLLITSNEYEFKTLLKFGMKNQNAVFDPILTKS